MRGPKSLPKGLAEALNGAHEKLSFVPDMHAEHAARATITVVQGLDIDFPHPIDITAYSLGSDETKSLSAFEPIYRKLFE